MNKKNLSPVSFNYIGRKRVGVKAIEKTEEEKEKERK
jgi:hypothetical protein